MQSKVCPTMTTRSLFPNVYGEGATYFTRSYIATCAVFFCMNNSCVCWHNVRRPEISLIKIARHKTKKSAGKLFNEAKPPKKKLIENWTAADHNNAKRNSEVFSPVYRRVIKEYLWKYWLYHYIACAVMYFKLTLFLYFVFDSRTSRPNTRRRDCAGKRNAIVRGESNQSWWFLEN